MPPAPSAGYRSFLEFFQGLGLLEESQEGLEFMVRDASNVRRFPVAALEELWLSVVANQISGKADLVDGKLDSSQLPDLAISDFLGEVANETAMLALVGQKGDWCIRTDQDQVWVMTGADPTLVGSWRALRYPVSQVSFGAAADAFLAGSATSEQKAEMAGRLGLGVVIPVSNAAARRALAQSALVAGVSKVMQATDPEWEFVFKGGDPSSDDNWIAYLTGSIDDEGRPELVVNMELEDVSQIVPEPNVLGRKGNRPTVGDGITEGGLGLVFSSEVDGGAFQAIFGSKGFPSDEAWRKSFRFVFLKATSISGTVITTTGYARVVRWDGTLGPVFGTGSSVHNFSINVGAAPESPFNTNLPKFCAIYPCNWAGVVSGELVSIDMRQNEITLVHWDRLPNLASLDLTSNQLTSFTGRGLPGLSFINLTFNRIRNLDISNLPLLTTAHVNNNSLDSFNLSGVPNLSVLYAQNNRISSFSVTGPHRLSELGLRDNQLTEFYGAGYSDVVALEINYNNLQVFDSTGMTSLVVLWLGNNNLSSVIIPTLAGMNYPSNSYYFNLSLANQNMTTDAVYDLLASLPTLDLPPGYLFPIDLTGNPCDAADGAPPNLVEDGVRTQAEIVALLGAKDISLVLTDGILTA